MKWLLIIICVMFQLNVFCIQFPSFDPQLAFQSFHFASASMATWNSTDCIDRPPREGYSLQPSGYAVKYAFTVTKYIDWHILIAENKNEHKIFLAFHGAVEVNDVNLPYFEDTVNHEVVPVYKKVIEEVSNQLESFYSELDSKKNISLIFTGYSLGGALAVLMAKEAVNTKNISNIFVYTFGQPRVGDKTHAEELDKNITNYYHLINGQDPIVHYPQCRQCLNENSCRVRGIYDCPSKGYSPSGKIVWYENGMDKVTGDTHKCVPFAKKEGGNGCWKGILSKTNPNGTFDKFSDHEKYFGVNVKVYGNNGCNSETPWNELFRNPITRKVTVTRKPSTTESADEEIYVPSAEPNTVLSNSSVTVNSTVSSARTPTVPPTITPSPHSEIVEKKSKIGIVGIAAEEEIFQGPLLHLIFLAIFIVVIIID